jgi:2-polyprenyl-3-methyl-5-hydroxy-6-metoxy-1,4-benzoquinol methylase
MKSATPKKVNKHKGTTTNETSWGGVAPWYDKHLESDKDTYHEKVVYPNMLRIIGDLSKKRVLDVACGQGQFSWMLHNEGAYVTGADIGKELIAIAKKKYVSATPGQLTYLVSNAEEVSKISRQPYDVIVCILALQNIENLSKTIHEISSLLVPGGRFIFVLNHPSFRIPRASSWCYDEATQTQYRRVDAYMSESKVKIDMTPGATRDKKFTTSFHRPLQMYIKALAKSGLVVTRLEEWMSHKQSDKGPRQKAENTSRKEIPLFMCIEAQKYNS